MSFRFDVAISFADEQRPEARELAKCLSDFGLSVFFDEYFDAELWGEDLIEALDVNYRKQSRFIILFISEAYRDKKWTRFEKRSSLAAALNSDEVKVLPVRFDDADLDGLVNTVRYVRFGPYGVRGIAELVRKKLGRAALPGVLPSNFLMDERLRVRTVWRVVGRKYAMSAFSGEGAGPCGGRWNLPGSPVVYGSSSPGLALAELHAAGIATTRAPNGGLQGHVLVTAAFPASLPMVVIDPEMLPEDAQGGAWNHSIREIGSNWMVQRLSCILRVPSPFGKEGSAYLLNPAHPDFVKMRVLSSMSVAV